MDIELKQLPREQMTKFLELSIISYANRLSEDYDLDSELAERKARHETEEVLKDQFENSTNHLCSIIDNSTNQSVGGIMYRIDTLKESAFGYQILVFEEYRKKGYARAAIKKLENSLKAKGIKKFTFNVAGNGEIAFNLYKSLGYVTANVFMKKLL